MAETLDALVRTNALIGATVYESFNPKKPGKIVDIVVRDNFTSIVEVLWINGEKERLSVLGLRNFQSLIDETKKKLKAHEVRLEKLKNL